MFGGEVQGRVRALGTPVSQGRCGKNPSSPTAKGYHGWMARQRTRCLEGLQENLRAPVREPKGGVLKKAAVRNKENQKLRTGVSDTEVDGMWGGGAEARLR